MPDENRKVEYSFTGDTSSLQNATQRVLNILDTLDKKVKQFGSSTNLNNMTSQMKSMSNTMRNASEQSEKAASKIRTAFSSADASKVRANLVTNITESINVLKNLAVSFDPVVAKIQAMKAATEQVAAKTSQRFGTIAAAFRRVAHASDEENSALSRGIRIFRSFMRLPRNLATGLATLVSGMRNLSSSTNITSKSFTELLSSSKLLNTALKALSTLLGKVVGKFLSTGIDQAIQYSETLNMFTTAMGDSNVEAIDFVNTMQELYGLDPMNIMKHVAMFYQLASAVDTPAAAAETMSKGLTKMSVDLASLFNMPVERVMENMTAGMQGMSRAVRVYGMDIRTTTLQQTALTLGIRDEVSEMSEADRQGLRYITMMRQAAVATGDFGKTIESPANQLKVLKEQVSQLGRAVGNFFIPILSKVLPYLNGFIMAIRTILNFLSGLLNISAKTFGGATDAARDLQDAASGAASGVGSIGNEADKAAKKLKNLSAPFDELNVLAEDTSKNTDLGGLGGGGEMMDPAIAEAIANMSVQLDNIKMKANEVRDSILDFLGFHYEGDQLKWVADDFKTNLIDKFPQWKKTIEATFENWDAIIEAFKRLGKTLWETFKNAVSPIGGVLSAIFGDVDWDTAFADFITDLPNKLNAVSDWIEEHQELFKVLAALVGAVAAAFGAWSIISPIVSALTPFADVLYVLVSTFGPVAAGIAAVVAVLGLAYKKFESVRKAVGDLKDDFSEMVDSVKGIFTSLWENVLQPIIENIQTQFKSLWEKHLSPLVEKFGLFAAAFAELFMLIVSELSKVTTALIDKFGPVFSTVFGFVVDVVTSAIGLVSDILNGAITVLTGIIHFLIGVFKGDWDEAWQGIMEIAEGLWTGLEGTVKGACNFIIDIINGFLGLIVDGLNAVIGGLQGAIDLANWIFGTDVQLDTVPDIPKIPHLAQGGVITSPTMALIGEGKYDEAVIPLGDSPQMNEMIQKIVDALDKDSESKGSGAAVFDITVNLDGEVIYKRMKKIEQSKGRDFKMGGFQRG